MILRENPFKMNDTGRIRELLLGSQKPLVLTHERPDGDAIGSLLAMGLALQNMGKVPSMLMVDGLPSRYRFMTGAEQVVREIPETYDAVIVLDCSDLARIGIELMNPPDLNIDHHPTNEMFAQINYVDHSTAATTELLYRLFQELDIVLDIHICNALMLGLITDTIGFRTPSVHPGLFIIVADLLEKGADLTTLYDRALNQRSFVGARYWGRGLAHLERQGDMLWTQLTLADRQAVDYPGDDDADLVNLLTTIESPKIVLIFVEQPEDRVKVSWRSQIGYDVAQVATVFGGGGHAQASGAMIAGSLSEVIARVLEATRQLMDSPEKENA